MAAVVAACDQQAPEVSAQPSWPAFVERFIESHMQAHPAFAVKQGRHEFDGQLPDWSAAGLEKEAERLLSFRSEAEAFPLAELSDQQRFERDVMLAVIDRQLFWLVEAESPQRNPAFYTNWQLDSIDPNVYIARPYADQETRLRAFITYAKNLPQAAQQIRGNLRLPLSRSVSHKGVATYRGLATFFENDVRQAFAEVTDSELIAALHEALPAAISAMQDLADWLDSQPAADESDFALGPEKFRQMLWMTERVDTPLEELEAIARADLARNQQALRQACAEFMPEATITACIEKIDANKPEGGPVAGARAQLSGLKEFLITADLVTIPGEEEAKVAESPPYARLNSAYIDIPGPYEDNMPSVYYISPPDPSWPPEVQRAYIPGETDLLFTSVHEVWPGHFLSFLHANRASSNFGRLFVSYAFVEGWAHYTEEMMWEAGLGDGDPAVHIGQILNALLRDVRFLSTLGLHTQGMTLEQSKRMFIDEAYQDEGTAIQQAARATYDPAYLNYTMGKLMLRKLREDWTASRGDREAWKAFHDAVLSYGAPPVPLLRGVMMGETAEAKF